MDETLPRRLEARLELPLPGRAVQARFQPELSYGRHFGPPPAHARHAAVLVLLYPHRDQWHLPLTLRPAHLVEHANQISLPGGTVELGERSQDAALRELAEELGAGGPMDLLGELSEIYLFASNFRITPWVAVSPLRPRWVPNAAEVAELLEVPLSHLLDPRNVQPILRRKQGIAYWAPSFCWKSHCIWGATSMILAELAALVAELDDAGSHAAMQLPAGPAGSIDHRTGCP